MPTVTHSSSVGTWTETSKMKSLARKSADLVEMITPRAGRMPSLSAEKAPLAARKDGRARVSLTSVSEEGPGEPDALAPAAGAGAAVDNDPKPMASSSVWTV